MIPTLKTAMTTLLLALILVPSVSEPLSAAEPGPSSGGPEIPPLRDDALGHALVEIVFEPEPEHPAEPLIESEPVPQAGDPYGFAAILNSYRASAGLPPLAYDPNLSAWASQNNAAQCAMGLGHHIMANFFQNCGYNQASIQAIAQSWMNSPGHAQNMLQPSTTRFGIAYGPGPYWTMNLQ